MADLIQRLRRLAPNHGDPSADSIYNEAADEIERLQAKLNDVCFNRAETCGFRQDPSYKRNGFRDALGFWRP